MKFLSYNIQYGKGQDGEFNLYRIAETVKEADVVCIQEIEKFWQRSGFVDQALILSEFLPKFYSVYGPALDMDASLKNEYGQISNRRRQFGNMILSRYPLYLQEISLYQNRELVQYMQFTEVCWRQL